MSKDKLNKKLESTAPIFLRLIQYKKRAKNKRNILKNFILINGGIDGIKRECGSLSFFLKYCGPQYHDIFSREYLSKVKKELFELEEDLKVI